MEKELDEKTRPPSNKKQKLWHALVGLLGLYALVITTYIVAKNAGFISPTWPSSQPTTITAPATNTSTIKDDSAIVSNDTDGSKLQTNAREDEEEEDGKANKKEKDGEETKGHHGSLTDQLDQLMGTTLPKEDLSTFKTSYKTVQAAMSPKDIAMNAITSLVVTMLSMAIIAGLAYLSYRSAESEPPLLPKELIHVVQNYARLIGMVAAGGLLLSSAFVWLDSEGKFKSFGIAHVSAIFFACIGVMCMFTVTFSQMSLNAQVMQLPQVGEGLLSGHSAQTLMSWLTVFLQYNLRILTSGLMIMWLIQFAVKWILQKAEGTKVHKLCCTLALPVTITYMSAKKSGSLMGSIFGISMTILTFALTVDLISPDRV